MLNYVQETPSSGVDALGLSNMIVSSAQNHHTPQELRPTSGAREADREPVGEAEINGPDELAGDEGTVGWFGRGTEEST
ncbi:hypothetical protein CFP56_006670 [Quercus suber]|uniref:Uncharacterized protein n=1 Tax=Quercus suber TaxID=58331 RepID=A0AAW0LAM4_QUESU